MLTAYSQYAFSFLIIYSDTEVSVVSLMLSFAFFPLFCSFQWRNPERLWLHVFLSVLGLLRCCDLPFERISLARRSPRVHTHTSGVCPHAALCPVTLPESLHPQHVHRLPQLSASAIKFCFFPIFVLSCSVLWHVGSSVWGETGEQPRECAQRFTIECDGDCRFFTEVFIRSKKLLFISSLLFLSLQNRTSF